MSYYLQDSRNYCGNDVMWWATRNRGYTTNLNEAAIFTKEEAQAQHNCRETDIPWPKGYVDQKTRPVVDVQYLNRKEALRDTGIIIKLPFKPKKDRLRDPFGRFVSVHDYYTKFY